MFDVTKYKSVTFVTLCRCDRLTSHRLNNVVDEVYSIHICFAIASHTVCNDNMNTKHTKIDIIQRYCWKNFKSKFN